MADPEAVTLADVARHAGVSLATASRALNGSVRKVNPELSERVVASARALHYTANAQAQAVARGTSRMVAVVVGDIADPYFSSIASGIVTAAQAHGLVVTMATAGTDADQVVGTISALRAQRPAALIVASSRRTDAADDERAVAELVAVEGHGGRIAFIGEAPGFRSVPVLNRESAGHLADALHDLGYRDFAILAGPPQLVTPSERARGLVDALRARGVRLEDSAIVTGGFSREAGYRHMADLLESGARPQCVCAVTDVMAVGAMAAIRDHGLEPGADIAVAGFDDIQMLQDVTPALTTVALPLVELGERALELAIAGDADAAAELSAPVAGVVRVRASTPALGR